MNLYEAIQRMEKRVEGQTRWLKENYPEVFEEQKHLDGGSPERAYWHYGSMIALRDTVALLQRSEFANKGEEE